MTGWPSFAARVLAAMPLTLLPCVALAQPSASGPSETLESISQGPMTQGPMTVERVRNGFLVAPEAKVTRFDSRTSELVGGYAGWVADDTVFFGGGGYFGAGTGTGRSIGYGGFIAQWLVHPTDRIGLSARGLIGGGQARLPETITEVVPPLPVIPFNPFTAPGRPNSNQPIGVRPPVQPVTRVVNFRSREDFFVAEPEVDLLVRLGGPVRLSVGGGYRLTSSENGQDSRIRGVTGGVALHIGGGL